MASTPLFAFEISAQHIRTFSAAVTALSAVGKEICLGVSRARSGDQAYLTLSAYDDAATSFGSFRFEERFFTRAQTRRSGYGAGDFACKILARTLFPALKRATAHCHAGGNTGTRRRVRRVPRGRARAPRRSRARNRRSQAARRGPGPAC